MGADSALIDGYEMRMPRVDEKIWKAGEMLIGGTGTERMHQGLRYGWEVPVRPDGMGANEYLSSVFMDGVRERWRQCGWLKEKNGRETDNGTFLIACERRLFMLDNENGLSEVSPFWALGHGGELALGSLATSEGQLPAVDRVRLALLAAERFSIKVVRPFVLWQWSGQGIHKLPSAGVPGGG